MRKLFLFLLVAAASLAIFYFFKNNPSVLHPKPNVATEENASVLNNKKQKLRLQLYGKKLKKFTAGKNYNASICFLIDMKLPSGKNRFFVYDVKKDSVMFAGLVAHGSCNTAFLQDAKFSNTPNCGCSSIGKYVVGQKYEGRFGMAFKLHGLDTSNSNAFRRFVVLHGYSCVPDKECYPFPLCNSLGCPMVSNKFLEKLRPVISNSKKQIVLWMFN